MHVAAVQFRGDRDHIDERRSALAQWIWGLGPGVDVVVCPEMAVTGYVFRDRDDAATYAEDPEGPTFRMLAPVAKALGTWVVCGFLERAGEHLYNSALVLDASGKLAGVYRKTLLFDLDRIWADEGDTGYRTWSTPAGDFAVGICMDLNDNRFLTWLEQSRPHVLAFPTNWLEEDLEVWPYWAARMRGIPTALVAANTWGSEAGVRFFGRSAILRPPAADAEDPRWAVVAAGGKEGDMVLRARV
jgi:predicted amidohydrolase